MLAKRPKRKAQSAMEYLMTYGWAIIIIALVFALLFKIGVFNLNLLGPRLAPGGCQVYRPYGPFTLQLMALTGVCTGELPQFVGTFGYSAPLSNAGTANLSVLSVRGMPTMNSINRQQITLTAWVRSGVPGPTETVFYYGITPSSPSPPYNGIYLNINSGICNNGMLIVLYTTNTCMYSTPLPVGKWFFFAMEYDGFNSVGYTTINGNTVVGSGAATAPYIPANASLLIATPWNGTIANIQQYNIALSANDVQSIYVEGVGGAPIELQNLVAWWPLNGNGDDYSGNNDSAAAANTAYSNAWTTGYSPP